MKLKKLKLKNFARFTEFECEFSDKVTRLVGVNGAGKSTVGLTAIWAGFRGIAEKSRDGQLVGERFRFIGKNGRSADIELTLVDEKTGDEVKLKRHITKDTNQISFESKKNGRLDEAWLTGLLNMSFLSAKHFASLASEQQARALGIDVSKFDSNLEAKKQEAQFLRGELKAFGEPREVEKAERVDVSALLAKRDDIHKENAKQEEKKTHLREAENTLLELREQKARLESQLAELERRLAKVEAYKKSLPQPSDPKDTKELTDKIPNAEEANRKAQAYETWLRDKERKEAKQTELDINLAEQKAIAEKRAGYIRAFDFGFAGLSVDEKGHLTLDDKPVRDPYFSRSELEIIVAKLHASINPDLKTRFIDDFEIFDNANQAKLLESLTEKGFQVIVAEVGDEAKDDNTILLRECALAKAYDETKKENLL